MHWLFSLNKVSAQTKLFRDGRTLEACPWYQQILGSGLYLLNYSLNYLFWVLVHYKIEEFINTHAGAPLVRASAKHRNRVLVKSPMLCSPDEVLWCGVSLWSRAVAVQQLKLHFYTEMCVWVDKLGNCVSVCAWVCVFALRGCWVLGLLQNEALAWWFTTMH